VFTVHGEGVPRVMFESHRFNALQDTDENLLRPQSKVIQYGLISIKLAVVLAHSVGVPRVMSDSMAGMIGTNNCFRLKSKVPFVTARCRRYFHWLWPMLRECHM
jgi:hypothetical protein